MSSGALYKHSFRISDDTYLRRETNLGSIADFGANVGVSFSNLSFLLQSDFTIHHSNGEDTTYDIRFDFKIMDLLLAGAVVLASGIVIVGGCVLISGAIGATTAAATAVAAAIAATSVGGALATCFG